MFSAEDMSSVTATYSTILPDDVPTFDPYHQPKRRSDVMQTEPRNIDTHQPIAAKENTPKAPIQGQSQSSVEKEQLVKHISSNRTLAFGLLFVVALLLIVIGYQAIQSRKLAAEVVQAQQNPMMPGDDPSGASISGGKPSGEVQQWPNTGSGNSASKQNAVRNDRILKQTQQKASSAPNTSSGRSSMSSHRSGRSDMDDKQRLATIVEESAVDEDLHQVTERTRAMVAEQLLKDAENDEGEDSLGTGSADVIDADTAARRDIRKVEFETAQMQNERDEALIEQDGSLGGDDDVDEDDVNPNTAQVVVLCSQVLSHGQRAGQECQRECRSGKSKCERHLAIIAKKAAAG